MTTEIQDTVNVIRALFNGLTISGQTIKGSWTYPWQESSIVLTSLPVTITSMLVGENNDWSYRTSGTSVHRWTAETLVLLANGPLKYPGAESAAAELLQDAWIKPAYEAFAADLTLGDTVRFIGASRGTEHAMLRYWIGHMQWHQQVFWGIRFLTQITQWANVSTSP